MCWCLTALRSTSRDEDFLTSDSLDFHPTDVLEDADGSLLVVDTGGWYKLCCPTSQLDKPDVLGAIYRVRRIDAKPIDDPRGTKIDLTKLAPRTLANLLETGRPAIRARALDILAERGSTAPLESVLARLALSRCSAQCRLDSYED